MFCYKCGHELAEDCEVCTECATPVRKSPAIEPEPSDGMHELLKEYYEKKEREERKQKEDFLIKLGLYEDYEATSDDYTYHEWANGQLQYYKSIPIDLTDEEYEKVKAVHERTKSVSESTKSGDGVAYLFLSIAWILYIGGAIIGLAVFWGSESEMSVLIWLSAFFSGTLFMGFGQVINLLSKINDKLSS